ncbi:MAG: DUF4838 domain-containing protein [Pirellulales bacterium]|nr:DUF4838 domain-containing protein [Pirellulales bacterium]
MRLNLVVVPVTLMFVPQSATAGSPRHDVTGHELRAHYVVLPAQPAPEETYAAAVLRDFVSLATGTAMPQTTEGDRPPLQGYGIYLGNTRRAAMEGVELSRLPSEEWRHLTCGRDIVLAGGSPRGTAYAVYEFIERHLGGAWLDPWTRYAPRCPERRIPRLDTRGRPAFAIRTLYNPFPSPADDGTLSQSQDFCAFNKVNSGGQARHGGAIVQIPPGGHTFGRFIPIDEFAKSNPEYFSMDAQGERQLTDRNTNNTCYYQFCPSNPNVRRIVVERALEWLRNDRRQAEQTGSEPARILNVTHNDMTDDFCLCPDCRAAIARHAGRQSGLLLEFINKVAEAVGKEFPKVTVVTNAYTFSLEPPSTIKPAANVLVICCNSIGNPEVCRPLAHPTNSASARLLADWGRVAGRMGVWHYLRTYPDHPPGFYMPGTNIRAIHADFSMLKDRGYDHMFAECEDFWAYGNTSHPTTDELQSFSPLRTWLVSKLLDQPYRGLDELLDTFFAGYYGAASEPMRALLNLIEDAQERSAARLIDLERFRHAEHLVDARMQLAANRLLDRAEKAVLDSPSHLSHVRRERMVFDSAFLWTEGILRRQAAKDLAEIKRDDVLRRYRACWQDYIQANYAASVRPAVAAHLAANLAAAEAVTARDTDPFAIVPRVPEADITVDGRLVEAAWRKAARLKLTPQHAFSTAAERHEVLVNCSATRFNLAFDLAVSKSHAPPTLMLCLAKNAGPGRQFTVALTAAKGAVEVQVSALDLEPPTMRKRLPVSGFAPSYSFKSDCVNGRWVGEVSLPFAEFDFPADLRRLYANVYFQTGAPDAPDKASHFVWSIAAKGNRATFIPSAYGTLDLEAPTSE